jgi:urease accessory protein
VRAPRRLVALAALLPLAARAHAPIPGIEGFYAGLAHPLREPATLLTLLAVALLLARLPPAAWRRGWVALAAGAAVGAAAGFLLAPRPAFALALLGAGLLAALLGTLPRPVPGLRPLAALCGAGLGVALVPDPGATADRLVTLAGALVTVAAAPVFAYGALSALAARLPGAAGRVLPRILQAWIAAVALLLGAFLLAAA